MVKLRTPFAWVIGTIAIVAPNRALASDPERGSQLFREGREAMTSHDYALACQKFIESEGADPHVGTLINLAQCEESLAKLATSRQYWQQALDLGRATSDPRIDFIERELARIDARVPRLTVRLAPMAPPDTVVRRDGVEFESASFGVPLPVETGAHRLTVSAPQHEPREYGLEVSESEKRDVVVEPGALVPAPAPNPGADLTGAAPSPSRSEESGRESLHTVACVAGAAGIVGLGIGATYGVLAINAANDASSHCNGDLCDGAGTAARNDEISKAQVATIGLATGGALLVGGALLRVLTPSPEEEPYVRRNLAFVLGATGLSALVVGSVFGMRAVVDHRDASAGCSGSVCDPQSDAAQRDEGGMTTASVVALGAGGAFLAGGVALLTTGNARSTATTGAVRLFPAALTGGGAMTIGGSW
jgi:hypothetical protein